MHDRPFACSMAGGVVQIDVDRSTSTCFVFAKLRRPACGMAFAAGGLFHASILEYGPTSSFNLEISIFGGMYSSWTHGVMVLACDVFYFFFSDVAALPLWRGPVQVLPSCSQKNGRRQSVNVFDDLHVRVVVSQRLVKTNTHYLQFCIYPTAVHYRRLRRRRRGVRGRHAFLAQFLLPACWPHRDQPELRPATMTP